MMHQYNDPAPVNIGVGNDISIADLASMVQRITGYSGKLVYDNSKPNGTPRKLLDVSRLTEMGFSAQIGLDEGIRAVYSDFVVKYGALLETEKRRLG